ncbi:MAG: hypothetical protein QXP56_07735 [Archaeoglobaceae archaeon]
MKEDEIVRLLERIEKALRVEEGYFIYVAKNQLATIEGILKDYGISYKIYETMMLDLYEIQLTSLKNTQIFDEIKAEIVNKGIPAHTSRMRLPMTGMITNVVYPMKENDYDYLVIDLGTARTDAVFNVSGTSFTVKKLTALNPVKIRFNDITKPQIELEEGDVFDFEFTRFYLTNEAEDARLIVFIGRRI